MAREFAPVDVDVGLLIGGLVIVGYINCSVRELHVVSREGGMERPSENP